MTAFLDNSPAAQRARLLDALRCGSVTQTVAQCLEILALGNCIHELRRDGHAIKTLQVWQPSDAGLINEASYVLVSGVGND